MRRIQETERCQDNLAGLLRFWILSVAKTVCCKHVNRSATWGGRATCGFMGPPALPFSVCALGHTAADVHMGFLAAL